MDKLTDKLTDVSENSLTGVFADVIVEEDNETIVFKKNPKVKEFLENLLKELEGDNGE